MPEKPQQPRKYDAVLGGTAATPSSGVVLGGLDGVKTRLASASVEVRVSAVKDALNYGETGIDLVIQALNDSSEEVQDCAYLLLRERTEPKIQQALKQFKPWKFLTCLRSIEGRISVDCSVVISPDGQTLICATDIHTNNTIKVWDINTGSLLRTLEGHSKGVRYLAISPDGQTLISSSEDCTIKVWDINKGSLLRTLEGHSKSFSPITISPDGQTLISNSTDSSSEDCTIKVWDINKGSLLRTLEGHSKWAYYLAISPDGKTIVSGSRDATIKVWDINTGSLLRTLEGHSKYVRYLAISPDGKTIVSGSADTTIKVWDIKTGTLLRNLVDEGPDEICSVAISPDGQTLLSGYNTSYTPYQYRKTIRVWDIKTGTLLRNLVDKVHEHVDKMHEHCVSCLAISPDGQTFISGIDKTIKVWDIKTGTLLRTLEGHSGFVSSVAISPDGQTLISSSNDQTRNINYHCNQTIKVWGVG
ncbi:MAG TPA: WD40 repeat domain-containing protein [Oculatellaceae cyanobacterium]|jgi:WD40 repeat protein